jgi:hypothetical protein
MVYLVDRRLDKVEDEMRGAEGAAPLTRSLHLHSIGHADP